MVRFFTEQQKEARKEYNRQYRLQKKMEKIEPVIAKQEKPNQAEPKKVEPKKEEPIKVEPIKQEPEKQSEKHKRDFFFLQTIKDKALWNEIMRKTMVESIPTLIKMLLAQSLQSLTAPSQRAHLTNNALLQQSNKQQTTQLNTQQMNSGLLINPTLF